MSQLYLHRLTVKQHSKHWLNLSLYCFFGWFFFSYVWLCFGGIFTQFVCFQFLRVCIQCCQKCFYSFCQQLWLFWQTFGHFSQASSGSTENLLLFFRQNIKRKHFFLLAASLFCRCGDSIHLFRFLSFFPSSSSFNIGNWFRHSLVQSFGEH